jgi:hypothetical protein
MHAQRSQLIPLPNEKTDGFMIDTELPPQFRRNPYSELYLETAQRNGLASSRWKRRHHHFPPYEAAY